MIFFMLTNILTETTELICEGQGALQLAGKAFHQDIELLEEEGLKEPVLRLPGVVSRKEAADPGTDVSRAGIGIRSRKDRKNE